MKLLAQRQNYCNARRACTTTDSLPGMQLHCYQWSQPLCLQHGTIRQPGLNTSAVEQPDDMSLLYNVGGMIL